MNELIRKAKNCDKDAFSQLMKDNSTSMYKVAVSILKNDEQVIVQDGV